MTPFISAILGPLCAPLTQGIAKCRRNVSTEKEIKGGILIYCKLQQNVRAGSSNSTESDGSYSEHKIPL